MSERELLDAWVRRRDADAFRQLCEQYAGVAYGTGLRIVGNGPDAEDITQECFLRLARLQTAISGSLAAWLHRVAVNAAIDRIRADAARRDRESRYAAERAGTGDVAWDDLREHVDAAINALPDKQRRAIVGHFIEGRSQHDLAVAEGISRASIHERIHRGLHTIRADLRRRGVLVGAATFGGLLTEGMAEGATVPAPLMHKLGTLTVYAGATQTAPIALFGAALSGKLLWALLIALAITGGAALVVHSQRGRAVPAVTTVAQGASMSTKPAHATDTPDSPQQSSIELDANTAPQNSEPHQVGATLEGYVRDHETGRPLEDVGIAWALDDGSNSFRYSDDELSRTDANGRYQITGLSPGRYKLLCTSAWETRDAGDSSPYEVELRFAGNTSRRSIEIASEGPVAGPDFDVIVGQTVSGRVVDADGRPVPEARVTLQAESVYLGLASAEDGSFKGGGFPVSDRFLAQATKGETSDTVENRNGLVRVRPADPNALTSGAVGPLALREGGIRDLIIEVRRGATVHGRLVDHRGVPIGGAHVMARTGQQPEFAGSRFGTSLDDGEFTLTGLAEETYDLAWNPRDENEPEDNYGWTPGRAEVLDQITLAWGDHRTGLVLRVAPPAAETGLTMTGRVTDSRGMPVAEANVSVRLGFASKQANTKSVKDGAFQISGLEEGEYSIGVSHPQYARYLGTSVVDHDLVDRVDVVLDDLPVASGRVIFGDTGKPAAKFSIGVSGSQAEPLLVEDPQGRFRIAGVFAGDNRIVAVAEGYATSETTVTLEPGRETRNVEIILKRGATVDGVVVTDRGDPVAGALIFSRNVPPNAQEREALAETRTNAEGHFHLENLTEAEGRIMAWHSDYPVAGAPYDATQKEFSIVMSTRTGSVTGHVTATGEPAVNARVELFPLSLFDAVAYHDDQRTDGQGRFAFTRVPEGAYRVHTYVGDPADLEQVRNLSREIAVVAEMETTVDLDIPAATSSLEGIVTYQGKAPPAGSALAEVTTPQGRQILTAELEPDGRYALEAMPAGHAEIMVSVVPNPPFTSIIRRIDVEVAPETALQRDIAFVDHGAVEGNVTGAPEDAWVEVRLLLGNVEFRDLDMERMAQLHHESVGHTVTSKDGRFALEAVPDGEYTILAYYVADGRRIGSWIGVPCRIDQGSTAHVTLNLP